MADASEAVPGDWWALEAMARGPVETPPDFKFNSHNIGVSAPAVLPIAARMLTLQQIEPGVPVFPYAGMATVKVDETPDSWGVWLDMHTFLDADALDPDVELSEERIGVMRLEHEGPDGIKRSHFIVDVSPVHLLQGVDLGYVRVRRRESEEAEPHQSFESFVADIVMRNTVRASGVVAGREDGPRTFIGSELFDEHARALAVVVFTKMQQERLGVEAAGDGEPDQTELLTKAVTDLARIASARNPRRQPTRTSKGSKPRPRGGKRKNR